MRQIVAVGKTDGMGDATSDELAIRNVIARLAHLADGGDLDQYLSLMTEDVVWSMPANPGVGLPASERHGHEEIAAGVRDRTAQHLQGPGSDTMHVVTSVAVELRGDEATSESTFLFFGTATQQPTVRSMGRYRDELRRTDDGWKLARRTIRFGNA